MARFGYFEGDSWSPTYGDIDWGKRQEVLIADDQLTEYKPVGFESGDGLTQELHQENLTFRLNRVDEQMDMVAVGDPRDGKDYIYFRSENPKRFETLLSSMGRAALCIMSEYPMEDTVAIWLSRATTGNDTEFLGEA